MKQGQILYEIGRQVLARYAEGGHTDSNFSEQWQKVQELDAEIAEREAESLAGEIAHHCLEAEAWAQRDLQYWDEMQTELIGPLVTEGCLQWTSLAEWGSSTLSERKLRPGRTFHAGDNLSPLKWAKGS